MSELTPLPLDTRNLNSLWCSVLAETLVQLGVTQVVTSPGSRSTPLTFACARHTGLETHAFLDERSAAFFALGLARRAASPTVLICTSGSAGANYFPAIIEAQESGTPLLILTADRPPEMRDCSSGQTIDQQKLFGPHVNFYHELAIPEPRADLLNYLRQTVAHALHRTVSPTPGPVHLNCPFRDPLPPLADDGTAARLAASLEPATFFSQLRPPVPGETLCPAPAWSHESHGLIIVGPAQPAQPTTYVRAIAELAQRLGWPVLAEGLSPLRNHADLFPHGLVTAYEAILRAPVVAERLRPEVVVVIGQLPTSKTLRAWLAAADAPTWIVTDSLINPDALHGRTQLLRTSPRLLANQLLPASEPNPYAHMWARYETEARTALDTALTNLAATDLFEGRAAWLLAQHLPANTTVAFANSMPVRDVEYFWPANSRRLRPAFSRGANGIDGTLSTALGLAHGNRPTVLLTGDLALLHDTNGFLHARNLRGHLTILLINNNGGGIFEHLPVAQFDPPFERYTATPQQVDFAQLARAYGVEHILIRDWPHLIELISTLPETGVRLLELRTHRKTDAATRKTLLNTFAASYATA